MAYTTKFPCSVTSNFSSLEGRYGDYRLDIVDEDHQLVAPLFFLDSDENYKTQTYDWILPAQIHWLRSAQLIKKSAVVSTHTSQRRSSWCRNILTLRLRKSKPFIRIGNAN